MLIDAKQLHIARRSLDLSLRDLGQLSGLSAGGISQIERTGQFQAYSMKALQAALVDKGAIFGTDGAVAIKMDWQEPCNNWKLPLWFHPFRGNGLARAVPP